MLGFTNWAFDGIKAEFESKDTVPAIRFVEPDKTLDDTARDARSKEAAEKIFE